MKNKNHPFYWLLWIVVTAAFYVWHPFSRYIGREHIPKGACLIAANHSSMADPIWILLALGPRDGTYIMAKKQAMEIPGLRKLLRWLGVFGVDRGGADLQAVKHSLEILNSGEKLMIFPEGTRVRPGREVEPKTGAALIAQRTGVPVLPVYITKEKKPFRPVHVVFGEPYPITAAARRATSEELSAATGQLMQTIYGLEAAK